MLVRVLPQDGPEEWGAGGQDQFVSLELLGTTTKCAVKEVFLLPDLSEGQTDVALEIIPAETKLLTRPHH